MKNVNIVEMLNLAEGDASTDGGMIVIGAKSSFSQVQDAVVNCLSENGIYHESEEMLSDDDKTYTNDQLQSVTDVILDFCSSSKTTEEKTFWFE